MSHITRYGNYLWDWWWEEWMQGKEAICQRHLFTIQTTPYCTAAVCSRALLCIEVHKPQGTASKQTSKEQSEQIHAEQKQSKEKQSQIPLF